MFDEFISIASILFTSHLIKSLIKYCNIYFIIVNWSNLPVIFLSTLEGFPRKFDMLIVWLIFLVCDYLSLYCLGLFI